MEENNLSCGCGNVSDETPAENKSGCCNSQNLYSKEYWISGTVNTVNGEIPKVSTVLTKKDIIDGWKARWGFNRMNFKLLPGLYCVGEPDNNSPVLVTANYKLTFDKLRKELNGVNAWILVLNTSGINVWCAAGKGTFGTEELIKRIKITKLKEMINNPVLILPQLGAVGVEAHVAAKETGCKVLYGPVYARDIKTYFDNNMKKNDNMKKITFNFIERLVLTPIELVQAWKIALVLLVISVIFGFLGSGNIGINIINSFVAFLGAVLIGSAAFPVLIPYIPFKSFALKGTIIGLLWALIIGIFYKLSFFGIIANIFILTPITAFLALNFTGATTYTSFTGVRFEVKIATPIFIFSIISGLVLKVLSLLNIL